MIPVDIKELKQLIKDAKIAHKDTTKMEKHLKYLQKKDKEMENNNIYASITKEGTIVTSENKHWTSTKDIELSRMSSWVSFEGDYLSSINRPLTWGDIGLTIKNFVNRSNDEAEIRTAYIVKDKKIIGRQKVLDFDKEDFVQKLWDALNLQFKIVNKIKELINFTRMFGPLGAVLDLIKGKAINGIIKYILIPVLVGLFTKKQQG
jgi:hypothetical protein